MSAQSLKIWFENQLSKQDEPLSKVLAYPHQQVLPPARPHSKPAETFGAPAISNQCALSREQLLQQITPDFSLFEDKCSHLIDFPQSVPTAEPSLFNVYPHQCGSALQTCTVSNESFGFHPRNSDQCSFIPPTGLPVPTMESLPDLQWPLLQQEQPSCINNHFSFATKHNNLIDHNQTLLDSLLPNYMNCNSREDPFFGFK